MNKLNIPELLTAVVSTVAAAFLIMTFTTVREVQTDVQVTMALLTDHKEQHVASASAEVDQTTRLTSVERQSAMSSQLIQIYHGVP